jgi:hypothetical protein
MRSFWAGSHYNGSAIHLLWHIWHSLVNPLTLGMCLSVREHRQQCRCKWISVWAPWIRVAVVILACGVQLAVPCEDKRYQVYISGTCKGITQTLIPDTLAVKPKASQSTDGNLLWSVVYISDTACLRVGAADDTQPALADPHPLRRPWPVTGGYAASVP